MRYLLAMFVVPVSFALLWQTVATFNIFEQILLPGPLETFNSLIELFISHEIMDDLWGTFLRVIVSFGLATLIGVPIGLFLGSSKKLYDSFEFLIDFFRSMPATAIFPVFMLVFGIADSSKIAVATFAGVLVIIFNTAHGVMSASKLRILVAKTMGASRWQTFRAVHFWESLPQTFIGMRVALNFCLIIIIVTEMFVGTNVGLGRKIIDFQVIYKIDFMYAVIILTGILGYSMNAFFASLQHKIVHWR